MASAALARRSSTKKRTSKPPAKRTSSAPPARRAGAKVVQFARARGAAVMKRASQSDALVGLAVGCGASAVVGAVAHKIPIPASVSSKVPTPALIGAGLVAASFALKGKARALVAEAGKGPLYAGAFLGGQKIGQTVLAGEFDDVGYDDQVPGYNGSGVTVAGEFDDLR